MACDRDPLEHDTRCAAVHGPGALRGVCAAELLHKRRKVREEVLAGDGPEELLEEVLLECRRRRSPHSLLCPLCDQWRESHDTFHTNKLSTITIAALLSLLLLLILLFIAVAIIIIIIIIVVVVVIAVIIVINVSVSRDSAAEGVNDIRDEEGESGRLGAAANSVLHGVDAACGDCVCSSLDGGGDGVGGKEGVAGDDSVCGWNRGDDLVEEALARDVGDVGVYSGLRGREELCDGDALFGRLVQRKLCRAPLHLDQDVLLAAPHCPLLVQLEEPVCKLCP